MTDEQKAATAPTGNGIVGEVVRPPWWDDPQEAHRETVRLLGIIAGELSTMTREIHDLKARFGGGGTGRPSPLAGLFAPRR
jgi:hypothetical protein